MGCPGRGPGVVDWAVLWARMGAWPGEQEGHRACLGGPRVGSPGRARGGGLGSGIGYRCREGRVVGRQPLGQSVIVDDNIFIMENIKIL